MQLHPVFFSISYFTWSNSLYICVFFYHLRSQPIFFCSLKLFLWFLDIFIEMDSLYDSILITNVYVTKKIWVNNWFHNMNLLLLQLYLLHSNESYWVNFSLQGFIHGFVFVINIYYSLGDVHFHALDKILRHIVWQTAN